MNYNPYDILEISINGNKIHARPFQFDSEPSNYHTLENKEGRIIRPTKLASICPDCGQGLEIDIDLQDAPEGWHQVPTYLSFNCYLCNANEARQIQDPFFNPIEDGRIEEKDIDPLLVGFGEHLVEAEGTVADRIGKENAEETPPKTKKKVKKKATAKASKAPKKSKKTKKKPSGSTKKPIQANLEDNKWPNLDE